MIETSTISMIYDNKLEMDNSAVEKKISTNYPKLLSFVI